MRFAIFKGEKNLTDLANRLFRIQGPNSQVATKQAADALLQSNPQFKDLSKVPVGSLVAIPDTAPPIAPGEDAAAAGFVRSAAAQNIQTALDSLQQCLSDIEAARLNQLKSGNDSFQTPEMRAALQTAVDANVIFPAPPPSLDSMAKDTQEILKNIQTAQEARKQVQTQLRTA